MARSVMVGSTVCGVIGLVFVGVGCGLIFIFKHITVNTVNKNIPLINGTEAYDNWENPPVPIYFQIWLFDILNYDEVVQVGDRPLVKQKGPYTYRERRQKVNITFNKNDTISYREERFFEFDRSLSVGPEEDTFMTLNLPLVTLATMLRYEFDTILTVEKLLIEAADERLFIKLSVAELMWGYPDPLLKGLKELMGTFNVSLPIDDVFGLFYNQNGTDDGLYTIFTGVSDVNKVGQIDKWNGVSALTHWTSKAANVINGSDGTIYPPFVKETSILSIFNTDIFRSIIAVFEKHVVLKGISLMRFIPPSYFFYNETSNPQNAGFCTPAGNCLPAGLLNISRYKQDAPVVSSQPHFYQAAPEVQNGIGGLSPNKREHETYLDLEALTGTPMRVSKKLQINVYLQNLSHVDETKLITPVYYPILWLNESASLDDATANEFKQKVLDPINITQAVQYGIITIGAFILICTLLFVAKTIIVDKKADRPLLVNPDTARLVTNEA